MEEKEYLDIEQSDGQILHVEVILKLHLESNDKDYIIYSLDETDERDLTILYTAEIVFNEDGSCSLETIEDETVWDEIKNIMKSTIKENSGE